jgi:CrcB protein
MRAMQRFLLVCLGGAAGSGVRYLVGVWAGQRFGAAFPYGTLIVNVTGCFLIALIMQLALRVAGFSPELRFFLTSGVLGGLTTYSSFTNATTKLTEDGAVGTARVNVGVSLAACLAAGVLGLVIARRLVGA